MGACPRVGFGYMVKKSCFWSKVIDPSVERQTRVREMRGNIEESEQHWLKMLTIQHRFPFTRFDRDWKKIEDFVGSKTVIQIRSHAQKYFLKVQKNGTSAHVPPPRPKRKATHPYPQKSPNTLLAPSQAAMPFSASFNPIAPGYPAWYDGSVAMDQATSGIAPSHDEYNQNMTEVTTGAKGFPRITSSALSAMGRLGGSLPASDLPNQEKSSVLHGLPDFAEVYGFIGSVFDPDTKGHVQKLKEMDPINFETVMLLMQNLTVNLSSPDFDEVY